MNDQEKLALARECDRYAAHLTNRNAMLDAADLFARCAIALRPKCSACGGFGLALNSQGELDECKHCKGNTVEPQ